MDTLLRDITIENIPVSIGGQFHGYNPPLYLDASDNGPLWFANDACSATGISPQLNQSTINSRAVFQESDDASNSSFASPETQATNEELPRCAITEHDLSPFDLSFQQYIGILPPQSSSATRRRLASPSPRNNSLSSVAVDNAAVASPMLEQQSSDATDLQNRKNLRSLQFTPAACSKLITDLHEAIFQVFDVCYRKYCMLSLLFLLLVVWIFYYSKIFRGIAAYIIYNLVYPRKWLLLFSIALLYLFLESRRCSL